MIILNCSSSTFLNSAVCSWLRLSPLWPPPSLSLPALLLHHALHLLSLCCSSSRRCHHYLLKLPVLSSSTGDSCSAFDKGWTPQAVHSLQIAWRKDDTPLICLQGYKTHLRSLYRSSFPLMIWCHPEPTTNSLFLSSPFSWCAPCILQNPKLMTY